MTHPGHNQGAWPTGCPLPPEDPEKLQGPEVGSFVLYSPKGVRTGRLNRETGEYVYTLEGTEPRVVKVLHRSYVWSPGECRSNGGYRHYDWSVIEEGPDRYRAVVVNDAELSELPQGSRIHFVYGV